MAEITALARKTRDSGRNLRHILNTQSRLKVLFILCFALALVIGLWLLFLDSFRFLDSLGGVGLIVVNRLFLLFFFGLMCMLILSGAVSAYACLFRSAEIPFLLARPFRMGQIVGYKYCEATVFSSWSFFFVIIPFVGAYAWHTHLTVFFSLWTLFFSIPFLLLCSGIGLLAVLMAVRWIPHGRALKWGAILAVLTVFGLAAWRLRTVAAEADDSAFVLTRMIPGLRAASYPLLPSWWVSEGIMALTRGQWLRGMLLWCVLLSNVLMLALLVRALGDRLYYPAWQRATSPGTGARRREVLFARLPRALRWVPSDARAIMLKDIRTFCRDPAQWMQVLIFFGLLGLYYTNLRSFRYHLLPPTWRNMIAFLNVFSVAAVLCSLGSRFVYPQLSLEGQEFWTIGLAPTTMARVLITKFLTALIAMLSVSTLLIVISAHMLKVSPITRSVTVGLAVSVSMAISALSTGLGAVFLDLKEKNPSAIVSSFGGTLNLVLSLFFMLGAILPYGILFRVADTGQLSAHALRTGLQIVNAWLILITTLSVWTPLFLGQRSLRKREY